MFLLDRFQEFYREVIRLKGRVARGTWVFEPETNTASNAAAEEPSATAVWRNLLSLLERQSLDAGRNGGDFAVEIYRRAQYAMAALADEIFLHLDWAGREAWRDHLLEARLFGSHRAGEELFERIEELLRDRDTVYTELARVYLTVLALGFQGKFRGQPGAEQEIEGYRRRLFRFVFGRDPQAVRGNERLMPAAYASTLDEGSRTTLPHLKPWVWALVLLFVLWIGGSHLIWRSAIAEVRPIVDEILGTSPAVEAADAVDATEAEEGQEP